MEILRKKYLQDLSGRLNAFPVVAILGSRQCGKTTLAKQFLAHKSDNKALVLDCEDPRDLAALDHPISVMEKHEGLVVIDEIQRRPELFPILRVLSDQSRTRRFLILGSASRDLIRQGFETLAGRISFMELGGFSLDEIQNDEWETLWIRGGFPPSFLAESDQISIQWREDFIRTFLERDIPVLGIQIPPVMLRRFWTMLSHYHGKIFHASEIGRSLQISDHTARRYLDLLTGTFLIRQVHPWFYNTRKRIVKRPKLYFRDTGLLHALMSIGIKDDLIRNPKLGASWEGFAIEQVIRILNLTDDEVFFWAVHTGAELDMVFQQKGKLWGVEAKWTDTPGITPSMRSAISELELEHLWIIHPGKGRHHLEKNITSAGLRESRKAFSEQDLIR